MADGIVIAVDAEAIDRRYEALTELETPVNFVADMVAMLLWKQRIVNPEMSVQVTPMDSEAFNKCVDYLKVKPAVRFFCPVNPTTGKLGEVAYIQLIDAETESSIRPVESDVETHERARAADDFRAKQQSIPDLVRTVQAQLAQNETSEFVINELCAAALLLAQKGTLKC